MKPDFDELKATSKKLKKFCEEHGIDKVGREYYFDIYGISYVVSPNVVVVRPCKGKGVSNYMIDPRQHKYVYIRSVQANLPRIYEDLKNGIKLDNRGNRI